MIWLLSKLQNPDCHRITSSPLLFWALPFPVVTLEPWVFMHAASPTWSLLPFLPFLCCHYCFRQAFIGGSIPLAGVQVLLLWAFIAPCAFLFLSLSYLIWINVSHESFSNPFLLPSPFLFEDRYHSCCIYAICLYRVDAQQIFAQWRNMKMKMASGHLQLLMEQTVKPWFPSNL